MNEIMKAFKPKVAYKTGLGYSQRKPKIYAARKGEVEGGIKKSTINDTQAENETRSDSYQTIWHQPIKTDAYHRPEVL